MITLPCRSCAEPVTPHPDTIGQIAAAQLYLKRAGFEPLQDNELISCQPCWERWRAERTQEATEQLEDVHACIGALRAATGQTRSLLGSGQVTAEQLDTVMIAAGWGGAPGLRLRAGPWSYLLWTWLRDMRRAKDEPKRSRGGSYRDAP